MINVSRLARSWGVVCILLLAGWLHTGCTTGTADKGFAGTPGENGPQMASAAPMASPDSPSNAKSGRDTADTLHIGDTLIIQFSDMPVLFTPKEERIKEDGTITLLEQKSFEAAGKTRGQLEKEIHDWYVPRFYVKMTVSVQQQIQTQFYYVRGEVRLPNRQVYISRITVLKAIASAGDFTDFASKTKVVLTRGSRTITINAKKATKDHSLDLEVLPGDEIYVPRRGPLW